MKSQKLVQLKVLTSAAVLALSLIPTIGPKPHLGLNDCPEFHPCCGPRCDDFTGHAALGFSLVRKHTVPVSTDERRGEPLLFILRRAVRVLEFGEIL